LISQPRGGALAVLGYNRLEFSPFLVPSKAKDGSQLSGLAHPMVEWRKKSKGKARHSMFDEYLRCWEIIGFPDTCEEKLLKVIVM
jgi:hypothetical protein